MYNKKINQKHFITMNAWEGLEINLVLLINLIIRSKAHNIHEMNSQIREAFFRLLRSYTTIESTIVNFSMKGLTSRMHIIELEEHIIYRLKDKITFPKSSIKPTSF
jgi:hypothetical protein